MEHIITSVCWETEMKDLFLVGNSKVIPEKVIKIKKNI